jgi:hypothetical protein
MKSYVLLGCNDVYLAERNVSQSKYKPSKKKVEAGGKLSMFLQNVKLSSNYTAIQPRIL